MQVERIDELIESSDRVLYFLASRAELSARKKLLRSIIHIAYLQGWADCERRGQTDTPPVAKRQQTDLS